MNTSRAPQRIIHIKSWCIERQTIHSSLLLLVVVVKTVVERLDLKEIQGLADFSSLREDFEEWNFPAREDRKSEGLEQYFDSIETAQNSFTWTKASAFESDAELASGNLYLLLANKDKSAKLGAIRLMSQSNDVEASRQLLPDNRPKGLESQHGVWTCSVQSKERKLPPHNERWFPDVVRDWELMISTYEVQHGESVRPREKRNC